MFDPPAEFEFDNRWDELAASADLIGWDPGGAWCALFSVGPWGNVNKLIERGGGSTERLRALPLRCVVAYRGCNYLWSIGDRGCTVWNQSCPPALEADAELIKLKEGPCARADLLEVRSFDDAEARDTHGVELALRDGGFLLVASMKLARPAWAIDLARALATYWGLPYRHVVTPGSRAATEASRRVAAEQSARLVDALVDAHARWDDPDRAAAREAREAEQDLRTSVLASRFYLESGQRRLAAWDRDDPAHLTVVEARVITERKVLGIVERRKVAGNKEAVTEELRARGDFIGATYRRSLVYWLIDGPLCMVWRHGGDLCALCRVIDVVFVGARSIFLAQLRAVVAFQAQGRLGHRGLALELTTGERVLVEENEDSRHDPEVFSGRAEGWNVVLARELAPALGVEARTVDRDVITRLQPPEGPASKVVASFGKPVLASALTPSERALASHEGRVLTLGLSGTGSSGEAQLSPWFETRASTPEDSDLVFPRPLPAGLKGTWHDGATLDDLYRAFGVRSPFPA